MKKRRSPESIEAIEARILAAALTLGNSLDAISMPELAGKAGIAVGTLYRIAPSKADLAVKLETAARAKFDQTVFAPFPARLNLRDRFALIWARLGQFALEQTDVARFLACRPFPAESGFIKASAVFARDGLATGELRALDGQTVAALVWGPLSGLLRNQACSADRLQELEHAIWDSLRCQ